MESLSISRSALLEKLNGMDLLLTLHDRFGGSFQGKLLHYCARSGAVVLDGADTADCVSFHQLEDLSSIKLHTKVEHLGWLTGKTVSPLIELPASDFDLDDYVYQAERMLAEQLNHAIQISLEQVAASDLTAKLASRRVIESAMAIVTKIAADSLGMELLGSVNTLCFVNTSEDSLKVKRSLATIKIYFNTSNMPGTNLAEKLERDIERVL